MIQKLLYKFIGLSVAVLCFFQQATAQFEEGIQLQTVLGMPSLSGNNMLTGSTNTLTDNNPGNIPSKILNVITLKIKEGQSTYFATNFTASVKLNLELTDFSNNVTPVNNVVLSVNYDKAAGATYKLLDYKTYRDYKSVKITFAEPITIGGGATGWDPKQVLEVVNEMRATRYYTLSISTPDLIPVMGYTAPTAATEDVLQVNWSFPAAAHENMTQLEWAYVETEMLPFYNNDYNLLFQNNSTRIDLDYSPTGYTYKIPLLYPGPGRLYYRARAVQRKSNGTLITGDWSAVSDLVNSFPVSALQHEPGLNWQSSTSFAEGGKSKTVIQYFDGSLRGRQTVTKDNSTGNTVVGETIYDLQGRASLQILPTPTIGTSIQYFKNFNRFSNQQLVGAPGSQYYDDPAKYFDLTPVGVNKCDGADSLKSIAGNGRYYSASNDWLNGTNGAPVEAKSKFIPDAQGYAYTETRFTDDATQRVTSQGGVGKDHQIGSGHETKYYYGKPSQPELDALFGTEVGDASHYSKNMVRDANGQISVSYVDMHGRTVATALAGDSTSGISGIWNAADYPLLTAGEIRNDLLTPTTNIVRGNSIESISTILVPAPNTNYNFVYKLNPAILQLLSCTTSQPVCFDCKYDLEISIRAEDCSDEPPTVLKYNNLQIVPANPCTTSMGFIGQRYTSPVTQIDTTILLNIGSYVIRKTLTINDSMFQVRKDSALKVLLCKTRDSIFNKIFDSLSISSGCGATPVQACDSCKARLGDSTSYRAKYLIGIGVSPNAYTPELNTTIYQQFLTDSLACLNVCGGLNAELTTLKSLRRQMLNDMIPYTGQYALPLDSIKNDNSTLIPDYNTVQAKYNIFSDKYLTTTRVPYFKLPLTEAPVTNYYYTSGNEVDSTVHGHDINGGVLLDIMTPPVFTNLFQPSWANSLITRHPEYSKLKYAEENLKTSYDWLDKMQSADNYLTAHNNGYDNPLFTTIDADPFFAIPENVNHKDTMLKRITIGIHIDNGVFKGYSIWQIANSAVLCATVDSTQKESCTSGMIKTNMDPAITVDSLKNKVWEQFRSMYLSYRNELVLKYIDAHATPVFTTVERDDLITKEHKQMVFATNQEIATQNGAGTIWTHATNPLGNTIDTTGLGAYTADNSLDNCEGQRPFWKARLQQCEVLKNKLNQGLHADSVFVNTIINKILDSLVMICRNSVTPLQPYGASTVNPAFVGNPRSFEAVINNVLRDNNIATLPGNNYYCNPFTVNYPKPYGLNQAVFTNYSNTLDSCACNRFTALKAEAAASTNPVYNVNSFSSMNQFLWANYHDSLTLVVWNGLQQCSTSFMDTCCKRPVINSVSVQCTAEKPIRLANSNIAAPPIYNCTILVSYQLPVNCDSCKILMYDAANNLIATRSNICGNTASAFFVADTCVQYKFIIKCQSNTCGLLKSDTARHNGCTVAPVCINPVITSVSVTSFSLTAPVAPKEVNAIIRPPLPSYNIHVTYQLPANCTACSIAMYDDFNNLLQTYSSICGTTVSNFPVSDTCPQYKFIVTCTDVVCGQLVSAPEYNIGCGLPTAAGVQLNNNRAATVNAGALVPCGSCVLNVNSRAQYGQPGQYIAKCEINFLPDFESVVNDDFIAYIDTALVPCDTACPKPVILSTQGGYFTEGTPYYYINVNYQLPASCSNCKIFMYNQGNTLLDSITGICNTSNQWFTVADTCLKYKFVVKCNSLACGTVISDTGYHNGCASPCLVFKPIALPGVAVIPAFLTCGYVKPCITCDKLITLTQEFRLIYPAYNSVPFLDSTATDEQARQNALWARFINFRVGFGKSAMDYMVAYKNCNSGNPPVNALCSFDKPLNDPSGIFQTDTMPCRNVVTQAQFITELLFVKMKDSLTARFDSLYKAKCLSAQSQEEFYVTYQPKEYHYTLYYYDQAGNLVKTLPPAAVKPYYDAAYLADIVAKRAAGTDRTNPSNNEVLATQYRYNSLNQVVTQQTPDAGISNFWYDRLGRLVVSQNAKQAIEGNYSYTLYDYLGRITQVGQKPQTTLMTQAVSQDETQLNSWLAAGALKQQITRTVYDVAYYGGEQPPALVPVLAQKNLRNRVSYTQFINAEPADFATNPNAFLGLHSAATYYSYDIHGNVDTLVQDFNEGYMKYKNPNLTEPALSATANSSGNRWKKMVYDYDLISGKVNRVAYQPGFTDQVYHKYGYDAENRITNVQTSHDSIYWENDAAYEYYRHGPMSRTVLGNNKVQGIDYAYTIEGWLKGVNTSAVLPVSGAAGGGFDMGQDGLNSTSVARDAYGYSLNYFNGDYKSIGGTAINPFVAVTNNLPAATDGTLLGKDLFNGNIRAMMVNIPQLGEAKLYGYRYDQLNRIKAMNSFNGFNNATNQFGSGNVPTVTEEYKERVTYDPNGNMKTYLRNGDAARQAMDAMTYSYKTGTNQLDKVVDAAIDAADPDYPKYNDIKQKQPNGTFGQANGNYQYDAIGNLKSDISEGITNISWTVYGKIQTITKTNGTVINYTYDATGNRITKAVTTGGVTKTTVYARDASGNVMGIYAKDATINSGALTQTEVSMYGSSRLGVWNINRDVSNIATVDYTSYSGNFTRGNKLFELSNHLGNVLVTISDKKIGVDASPADGIVDYYNADVVTANDYYPFGMQLPGRSFTNGSKYRYGFNGQEKSDDVTQGNYTAEFWEYDSRIGRRWNVDPKPQFGISEYVTFNNNPIFFTDGDGDVVKVYVSKQIVGYTKINLYSADEVKRLHKKQVKVSVPVYKVTVENESGQSRTFYYTRKNLRADVKNKDKVEDRTFDVMKDGDIFEGVPKKRWGKPNYVLELRKIGRTNFNDQSGVIGMKADNENVERVAIQFHIKGASDGCLLACGKDNINSPTEAIDSKTKGSTKEAQVDFMTTIKLFRDEDVKNGKSNAIQVEFQREHGSTPIQYNSNGLGPANPLGDIEFLQSLPSSQNNNTTPVNKPESTGGKGTGG
jgi:YD repeat-containing protein